MRLNLCSTSAFVFLTLTGTTIADSLDDAVAAWKRGDEVTATRIWYELAGQGVAKAQAQIGDMMFSGIRFPQDYELAAKYYRLAAEQGDADGERGLGDMYESGLVVPHDDAEAAKWFRKAAEQGDARAQEALGAAYEFGRGVPKDYVLAYMWLNLASASRVALAAGHLREDVAKLMTPDAIAEAQRMAREWKPMK